MIIGSATSVSGNGDLVVHSPGVQVVFFKRSNHGVADFELGRHPTNMNAKASHRRLVMP